MAQENVVNYTPEMDSIIKEEAKASPKNLAASFRNSSERIKKELEEKNITPEKVMARYYLKFNKRKPSSRATRTTPKAEKNKTVKTVKKDTNVTEIADEKYSLMKELADTLNKRKKMNLIKYLYSTI